MIISTLKNTRTSAVLTRRNPTNRFREIKKTQKTDSPLSRNLITHYVSRNLTT